MKKLALLATGVMVLSLWMAPAAAVAQEEGGAAPAAEEAADAGMLVTEEGEEVSAGQTNAGSGGFISIILGSGVLGVILWLALFGAAGAAVYFVVDCAITVRPKKIIPEELVANVNQAMSEGDVLKALQHCENEPGPLANVLTAGFSHVEEGFDVIQEAVGTAADLETEKLTQKLTWLSVVGNIAPMLGLLGTVQGMIAAFSTLGQGAPDVGELAMNISQALFTTAGGLTIAVPCVGFYYAYRNSANKIILRMEAMTMELIKDLRNVEVVEE